MDELVKTVFGSNPQNPVFVLAVLMVGTNCFLAYALLKFSNGFSRLIGYLEAKLDGHDLEEAVNKNLAGNPLKRLS